ncbi:MAG: hypothetical protein QXR09_00060 [Candidatus Aenigmatarchaeota archaeon]
MKNMNPLLLFLGIIDACGALLIYFGPNFPIIGAYTIYFAYMLLVKGILSIFTSFPIGIFDWMGILDLLAGIVLVLISFGVNFQIFHLFAILYIFKAVYVLTRTIFNF